MTKHALNGRIYKGENMDKMYEAKVTIKEIRKFVRPGKIVRVK